MSNSCHESVGDSPNAEIRLATYLPQYTEVAHPQCSACAGGCLASLLFAVDTFLCGRVRSKGLPSASRQHEHN